MVDIDKMGAAVRKLRTFICGGLLLAAMPASAAAEVDAVACISDVAAPPYTVPGGEGYSQYIAGHAARAAGFALRQVVAPRKRCLESVRSGRYQLLLIVADDPVYLRDYAFPLRPPVSQRKPDSYRTVGFDIAYVVTARPAAVRWDGKTLSGFQRPLLVRSGSQRAAATLRQLGVPYHEVPTPRQIFAMLQARRADAAVMREYDIGSLCRQLACSGQLYVQPTPLFGTHVYIVANQAFAAQHAARMARFWDEVGRISHAPDWPQQRRRLDVAMR